MKKLLEYPRIKRDGSILRKPERKDEERLSHLFGIPLSKEKTRQMLDSFTNVDQLRVKMILIIADEKDEAVGVLELYHLDQEEIELGYRVLPEYQKKGYAVQAVSACMDWLKTTDVHWVKARVQKNNPASMCVLERNGFMKIRTDCNVPIVEYQKEVVHDHN